MPNQYLNDDGELVDDTDPVAAAKQYLNDNGEPSVKPVAAEKPKSAFDKLIEFGERPLTTFASRHLDKPSEDLMSYGESGDDLRHKAALYGGGFLHNVGEGLDSLTSPTNLALTAATGGASVLEKTGLSTAAKLLEAPGRLAGAAMIGHGGVKAYNADNTGDRIAGIAEAALGYFGSKGGHESEVKSADLPEKVPAATANKPNKKSAFEVMPDSAEKNRLTELASKGDSITADELVEAQKLNRKIKSLAKTKDEISKFATRPEETVTESVPSSKFIGEKPKVRPAYDDAGRLVGYEPIVQERPARFDTVKSEITPTYLDETTGEPIREPETVVLNDRIRNEPVSDEQASRFSKPSETVHPSGLTDKQIREQFLANKTPEQRKGILLQESANRRAVSGNLTDKEYVTAKQLKPGDTVKVGDSEGEFQSVAFGKAKIKTAEGEVITVPHSDLVRTKRGPQWPEGMPLDQRIKAEVMPSRTMAEHAEDAAKDMEAAGNYEGARQQREVIARGNKVSEKPIDSEPIKYLDEKGEPSTNPDLTFSHFDAEGKAKFHDATTGSDLPAEELADRELPPVPEQVSQIPAPIKAILDTAGIDSSQMDVTTAVNKARELRGQESTTSSITPQPPQDSLSKFRDALKQSTEARPEQEVLNANERSVRAGKMSSVETPGLAGHYERLAKLKGEFPKIPIESKLTQSDLDTLIDHAKSVSDPAKPYELANIGTGLTKLFSGQQVTPYESKLLGKTFGSDIEDLIYLHGGLGVTPIKDFIHESVNLPKTMMATADLSAPLRQGLPLITTKEYWNSFRGMVRNEASYNQLQEALQTRPKAEFGNQAGLYLADTVGALAKREEQFISNQVDKVPLIGTVKKGSEYAYTGFLNKLRADTFDNLIDKAEKAGIKTSSTVKGIDGEPVQIPNKVAKDIASFVNNSTGRGSLGRLEKNAVELNSVLFSPRLISSRLTMLNPMYYAKLDPFVRKQALKALFSVAGAGILTTELLKKAGASVNTNPTSSDFGKAKFGNIRLDPYGGFQQYIVAASRLIKGETTSINGNTSKLGKGIAPSRLGLILGIGDKNHPSLLESKASPIAGFIDDLVTGREFPVNGLGGRFGANRPSAQAINLVTPMLVNDLYDLKKEDPDLIPGISLAALATFGDSLQVMDEPKPKSAFRMTGMGAPKP